jgi:hypothetical protein
MGAAFAAFDHAAFRAAQAAKNFAVARDLMARRNAAQAALGAALALVSDERQAGVDAGSRVLDAARAAARFDHISDDH